MTMLSLLAKIALVVGMASLIIKDVIVIGLLKKRLEK